VIVVCSQAWTQYSVEPEKVDRWVENLRKVNIIDIIFIVFDQFVCLFIYFFVYFFVCFFVSKITRMARAICMKFSWKVWSDDADDDEDDERICFNVA